MTEKTKAPVASADRKAPANISLPVGLIDDMEAHIDTGQAEYCNRSRMAETAIREFLARRFGPSRAHAYRGPE